MARRAWTFEAEDGSHTVELEHGTITGHRIIHLDGQLIHMSRALAARGAVTAGLVMLAAVVLLVLSRLA